MALNWLAALKAVPWSTLLDRAPTVVDAANRLLSNSKRKKADLKATSGLESLNIRIAALEEHDQADAAVVKQLADEVANLASVSHVVAARVRIAILLATCGVVIAIAALAVALF